MMEAETTMSEEVALDGGNAGSDDNKGDIKVSEINDGPVKKEPEPEVNPHSYLNRNEFTSERFKIEVSGLPKYYGFSELRKVFNDKLKVNAHKLIPPKKGCFHMFINFKSEEDRMAAVEKIDGYVWKNRTLSAKPARPAEDPLIKKRMHEDIDNVEEGLATSDESVAETIRRVTTPWWNIPYEEQLDRKMKIIMEVFKDMRDGILKAQPLLKQSSLLNDSILERIKPSPITKHYRNKCEFSIGYNPESKEKTVGFRLSSYKKGSVAVGPIDSVDHLPESMKKSALEFQEFVRQSKYEIYNPETHQGCYRQLTVRVTSTGDVLMMVALRHKEMTNEEFIALKEEMKAKFSSEESNIKSFYLKLVNDHGNPDNNPPELLFGSETISETLLGLKFDVSPEAFFQVNIPATQVLYKTIGDMIGDRKDTTLLDVCSGTGTIGISVSDKCLEVLGIEMVASAVVDARKNAEINGLSSKCEFFPGKAEDIVEPVIVRAKSEKIIAVVDPPRAGLHQKVLFTLRKCEKIETLIYVACNARSAMKNFIDLCRPSSHSWKGKAFIPIKLIPVDMFPNSPHFELVIVFKRLAIVQKELSNDTATV